jgi:hypothetical protein
MHFSMFAASERVSSSLTGHHAVTVMRGVPWDVTSTMHVQSFALPIATGSATPTPPLPPLPKCPS